MRTIKCTNGKLRFSPEEWRTAKQIGGFFSRYAAAQRKQSAMSPNVPELENKEIDENDLEAWEAETNLQKLQNKVFDEIDFAHPIEFNGNNICKLVKGGKLAKKFKVAELKEMCNFFEVDIDGPLGHKKSYIKSLEVLVQSCNCSLD